MSRLLQMRLVESGLGGRRWHDDRVVKATTVLLEAQTSSSLRSSGTEALRCGVCEKKAATSKLHIVANVGWHA